MITNYKQDEKASRVYYEILQKDGVIDQISKRIAELNDHAHDETIEVHQPELQKVGIDALVFTVSVSDGSKGQLLLDYKFLRKGDPNQATVEILSNVERKVPGWISGKRMDYVVYVHMADGKVIIAPYRELEEAWERTEKEWEEEYKTFEAQTGYRNGKRAYRTRCIKIPYDVLFAAMRLDLAQHTLDFKPSQSLLKSFKIKTRIEKTPNEKAAKLAAYEAFARRKELHE